MKANLWARRVWRCLFIVVPLLEIGIPSSAHAAGARIVPIEQLRAAPERFEGQRVRVIGFLQLDLDQSALYPTREDFNSLATGHALLLTLTNAQLRSSSRLNHGHVLVDGVFHAEESGHDGTPRSSLKPVIRLQMWRKPRK